MSFDTRKIIYLIKTLEQKLDKQHDQISNKLDNLNLSVSGLSARITTLEEEVYEHISKATTIHDLDSITKTIDQIAEKVGVEKEEENFIVTISSQSNSSNEESLNNETQDE